MPRRPTHLERWQVAAAFVTLVGAFALGLYAVTSRANVAVAIAKQDARDRTRIVKIRQAQLRATHKQDVRSCSSRHQLAAAVLLLDGALTRAEAVGIAQAREIEKIGGRLPGLTRAQSDAALANADRLVHDLRTTHHLAIVADCTGVPPLPGTAATPTP